MNQASEWCPVVGVGASAGGLEALQQLLGQMPPDPGAAIVVVSHLDPHHPSMLPELLGRATSLPVEQAADGVRVQPDRVYVIAPNMALTIKHGVLSAASLVPPGHAMIDLFFSSLAEDLGPAAVCIVLSGTGSDGTRGVQAIKEHGGMTMAQSADSAAYDSMPRSAIALGMVDFELPPEAMPARIVDYLARVRRALPAGAPPVGGEEELELPVEEDKLLRVCALLQRRTGHDFSGYKRTTLVRRTQRRMTVLGVGSLAEYLELIDHTPGELDRLFRDLLIGVTHFFRDPEAFEVMGREIIPLIVAARRSDDPVRVWVPGCSTGEEAYSLAILFRETAQVDGIPVKIFATDIDERALEAARTGRYPSSIAEHVSPERLDRFFLQQGELFQIRKEIREMCVFSAHNLITDPPFSRLDLISCRNLLIYLENEPQRRIFPLFHYALRPSGYLLLGPSENVTAAPMLFSTVDAKRRIFQRKDVLVPVAFPVGGEYRSDLRQIKPSPEGDLSAKDAGLTRVLERVLLSAYAPPAVVVNAEGDILFVSGRTRKFLELAPGMAGVNVLDMVRKDLRPHLHAVLHEAKGGREERTYRGLSLEQDGGAQQLDVSVRPLHELRPGADLYAIVFREVGPALTREQAEAEGFAPREDGALAEALERELRTTKEQLQTTVEELEVSNEEMKSTNEELLSTNEELQSANEELQTSKEELQAINEELQTVNAELTRKVDDLDKANNDLHNLFASTRIPTVFLDRNLKIKKFSPDATELFRLIESDVGRPVTDIAPAFADPDLLGDIREVLRTTSPSERQVRRLDRDVWYLRRIQPYQSLEEAVEGVVISFVDISALKSAQDRVISIAAEQRQTLKEGEEAQRSDRRKTEFLAMLAHELRNPLSPIVNAVHLLKRTPSRDPTSDRALSMIDRQVQHMVRLIDDLLDLSRISSGKILLRKQRVDLAALARSVVEDHRAGMEAGGISVELSLPPEPRWVDADATRLAQCLGNLLHNAIKFTDPGGRIAVEVLDDAGGAALLRVRDSGVGMGPEILARAFEPFAQAEHHVERGRGGLGLGLGLVKALVEMHGGTVTARSEGAGRGSELTIRLPLLAASAPAPAPVPPVDATEDGEASPGTQRRVLVIEDNQDAAESVRDLLEIWGHEAVIARTGVDGVDVALAMQPDLVLCDISLEGSMSGYDVAEALRRNPATASMYLIAVTGYGMEEDQRRALQAGFDRHVTKPVRPEALAALVESAPERPPAGAVVAAAAAPAGG